MADIAFTIGGQNAEFLLAIRNCQKAVDEATASMKGAFAGVTAAFGGITSALAGLTAAFGAGEFLKVSIEATAKLAETSIGLGKALGVSASEASVFGAAIATVGGNTEDYSTGIQQLTRQVKTHEGALNDMGIKTRDVSGHLRDMNDVFFDAIDVVNSYKEGTDRDLAAQTAFGRGVNANNAIFRLNKTVIEDAKNSANELGIVIGQKQVDAFERYRTAIGEAGNVTTGLKAVIGNALMPVLTQFAEWLREIGPALISEFREDVADVVSVFWGLYGVLTSVWDVLKGVGAEMQIFFSRLGAEASAIASGNGLAIVHAFDGMGAQMKASWASTMAEVDSDLQKTADKINDLHQAPVGDAKAPGGGRSFHQDAPGDGTDNIQKVSQRYADLEIAEANRILDAMKKAREEELQATEETKLGEIEVSEKALSEELKAGQISGREFLKQEDALIEERLLAQKQYYAAKLALAAGDEVQEAEIQRKIAEAETLALKQRQVAQNQATNAEIAMWKNLSTQISSSFAKVLTGVQF